MIGVGTFDEQMAEVALEDLRGTAQGLGYDPELAEASARSLARTTGVDFVSACSLVKREIFLERPL